MDIDALLGLLFFVVFIVVPMINGARKRGQNAKGQQQGQTQQGQQQQGQQRQAGQGQGQQAGRPSAQGPGGGGLSGPPQGAGAQPSASNRQADHPAASTLEEIRRRVQEAQERERQREGLERTQRRDGGPTAGPQSRAPGGLVSSDPFERGLVSGQAQSIAGGPMGREGAPRPSPSQTSGLPSVLGREGLPPRSAAGGRSGGLGREGQAVQPQVQRRRGGRSDAGLGREGSRGLGAMPTGKRSPLGREGRSPRSASLEAGEIGAGDAQPALSQYGARLGRSSLINVDRDGIVTGLIWHEILKEAPSKKRLRRTRSRPQ